MRGRELLYEDIIQQIRQSKPLSEVLDKKEVCRRGGWAHRIAKASRMLKPTQLRRFFGPIKAAAQQYRHEGDKVDVGQLIELVPMIAYARGRGLIPEQFAELLFACLDPDKIQTSDDIAALEMLLTAVVAWHKYEYPGSTR